MSQRTTRRGPVRVTLVGAAAAAFMVSGSACSIGGEDESIYCVDGNLQVVSDDWCDDDGDGGSGNGFFLWKNKGKHKYKPGSKVAGGQLIRTDDRNGRIAAGLAASGRVKSGTVTRGGFGGKSGSGSSGS
ncbi:hypothetical protein [Pilimelia columellifera]|uniref:Lipoprotein n=1 Tax=Pilimelia columellifera subsp. columellifera TaxID=706583 RepID=A0ABN3N7H3_9ACTN